MCRMGSCNSSEEEDFCWRRGLDLELNINKSSHVVGKNRLEYTYMYKCAYTLVCIKLQSKLFWGVEEVDVQSAEEQDSVERVLNYSLHSG